MKKERKGIEAATFLMFRGLFGCKLIDENKEKTNGNGSVGYKTLTYDTRRVYIEERT